MEVIRVDFLSILLLFTQPGLHSQSETGHQGFVGFTAPEDKETNKKSAFPQELLHCCKTVAYIKSKTGLFAVSLMEIEVLLLSLVLKLIKLVFEVVRLLNHNGKRAKDVGRCHVSN